MNLTCENCKHFKESANPRSRGTIAEQMGQGLVPLDFRDGELLIDETLNQIRERSNN